MEIQQRRTEAISSASLGHIPGQGPPCVIRAPGGGFISSPPLLLTRRLLPRALFSVAMLLLRGLRPGGGAGVAGAAAAALQEGVIQAAALAATSQGGAASERGSKHTAKDSGHNAVNQGPALRHTYHQSSSPRQDLRPRVRPECMTEVRLLDEPESRLDLPHLVAVPRELASMLLVLLLSMRAWYGSSEPAPPCGTVAMWAASAALGIRTGQFYHPGNKPTSPPQCPQCSVIACVRVWLCQSFSHACSTHSPARHSPLILHRPLCMQ